LNLPPSTDTSVTGNCPLYPGVAGPSPFLPGATASYRTITGMAVNGIVAGYRWYDAHDVTPVPVRLRPFLHQVRLLEAERFPVARWRDRRQLPHPEQGNMTGSDVPQVYAELTVPGSETAAAFAAVVPGPGEGDRAEHGVERLVPVAGEAGLVAVPARDPLPAVAPVGGQDLAQHGAAQAEQPGPDHPLRRLHAGITAAQDPGRLTCEPS
jgi:hypothetical protein